MRCLPCRPLLGCWACSCFLLALVVASDARQQAPKPVVPVAADAVAAHPDDYIGQVVSLTANVDRILSPTTFAIDQSRSESARVPLLVIAPTLNAPVERGSYVTVLGEIVRYDVAELARRLNGFTPDLPADAADALRGRPVVLASSVINSAMVDVARRPPPPLTPEEEAFATVMKRVGPSFTSLRQAVEASDASAVEAQSATLARAFADTHAFWKGRGRTDAMGWAQEARAASESLGRAAAAGNWEDVKTLATGLGRACQACHGVYRERLDDGSYRIKADGKSRMK